MTEKDINEFGQHSLISWTEADLRQEREDEESVFSDKEDWYIRMRDDQRGGWADYS